MVMDGSRRLEPSSYAFGPALRCGSRLLPDVIDAERSATVRDGLAAGAIAAVVSGTPSTLHAMATRASLLDGALAAGSLLLPRERRRLPLLLAAIPAHTAISLGWAVVLSAALPRRGTVPAGALAGLAIAALDLGVIGRRHPRIRALPLWPQVADHLAFGTVAAAAIAARRSRRGAPSAHRPESIRAEQVAVPASKRLPS